MSEGGTAVPVEGAFAGYLRAIVEGDRRRAFGIIDRAREVGIGIEEIYLEVFQPALREVGRLWQENRISVADEHLATAITQGAMVRLFEEVYRWQGGGGPLLIAACSELERHEVGLRMICDLLELRGWETRFLGATVPPEDLVAMVADREPEVVALSASITPHITQVRAAIATIRERLPDPPLLLAGGQAFLEDASLAERIGADLTARDAREVVALLTARFATA